MKKLLLFLLTALVTLTASAAMPRISAARASELLAEGKGVKASGMLQRKVQKRADARLFQPASSKVSIAKALARAKAPARVTSKGANLFGYVSYADGYDEYTMPVGLYEFQGDQLEQKWLDPLYQEEWMILGCGYYQNNRLCGYAPVMWGAYVMGMYFYSFDFETGEYSEDDILEIDIENGYFSVCTLNEDDNTIYGIGMDGEGEHYIFAKAPADDPAAFEVVKVIDIENEEDQACPYICFNPVDHNIYGISYSGKLVTISPSGDYETIMDVSSMGETVYIGTMAYSNVAGGFYVNHTTEDASELFFINTKAGTVEKLMDMPDGDSFSIMVCLDGAASPGAPAAPAIVSSAFEGASTTGTVTVKLPAATVGGTALEGNLAWTAELDREVYKTGTAAAGEEITVDFTEIGDGMHNFAFYATTGEEKGLSAVFRLYTGNDTPMATEYVGFEDGVVSWMPVDKGVHGGYLDLAKLEYKVFVNGELYGTTAETEYNIELHADAEMAAYTASVVVTCNGKDSEPTSSNSVVAGKPFTPDVTFVPTPEQAPLFTISDDNYDEATWEYYPDYAESSAFISYYSSYDNMDDWLFLPAVSLEKSGAYYRFAMNVGRLGSTFDKESYSVAIGTAPSAAAMTQTIIESTLPEHNGSDVESLFKVETPGTYYIGIHATSEANQYGIFVRNMCVTDPGITEESPAAVTDLAAVGAENGVLEATVSFSMPSKKLDGTDLAADTEITATVKGAFDVKVTGAPGEKMSVVVGTEQGTNRISVVAAVNNANSPAATVDVYTGVDNPRIVTDAVFTVSDDMLSVHIAWKAPVEGANGGYIDPEDMDYAIWINNGYGYQPFAEVGHNVFEYTYTVPAGSEQNFYRLGVVASNAAGTADYVAAEGVVLGTPYELPMAELFDEGDDEPLAINPFVISYPTEDCNGQNWSFRNLSELFGEGTEGSCMMALQLTDGGGKAAMGLPRFTTEGKNTVTATVEYWGGNNGVTPWFTASAPGVDGIVEVPAQVSGADGWFTATATLPAQFLGKRWVQLYVNGAFKAATEMLIITKISVDGATSGVDSVVDGTKSLTGGVGEVVARGFAGEKVNVYTADGRLVASVVASSDCQSIPVGAGIYVANAAGKTNKVVVK